MAVIPAGLALIGPLRRGQRAAGEVRTTASGTGLSRPVATGVVVAVALGALTWGRRRWRPSSARGS